MHTLREPRAGLPKPPRHHGHSIADILMKGTANRVVCTCGFNVEANSPGLIDKAYSAHRREVLGVRA